MFQFSDTYYFYFFGFFSNKLLRLGMFKSRSANLIMEFLYWSYPNCPKAVKKQYKINMARERTVDSNPDFHLPFIFLWCSFQTA